LSQIEFLEIAISEIKIGKRFRKDLGDIQSLADSMKELELFNPVTIDKK